MTTPLKIACIGEAMIEVSASALPGPGFVGVAGDTLNTAIYLRRRMADVHSISFVSALGTDNLSENMLSFMAAEGIDTTYVERNADRLPGLYAISTDVHGERSFMYWREHSAARLLFDATAAMALDDLTDFDVIYTSAITLAILSPNTRDAFLNWIAAFRQRGGRFAFDSNYRPRLWESLPVAQDIVSRAWAQCDIALPSLDDEQALFNETSEAAVLHRFATYSIPTGVLKRGADGPVPLDGQVNNALEFPAATRVVDTTAAGDSFSGTFLGAHLEGETHEHAMLQAHGMASRVVGIQGAIMPLVTHG